MPLAYIPSPPRSSWQLGPVPVRGQALCVVAGILLALWVAGRRYRRAGGEGGVIADVAAWAVTAGLIPAALGVLLGQHRGAPWQDIRTWDAVLGVPGAVALGALAAWAACRRLSARARPGQEIRLGPVAGAVAPAIAFGQAVAAAGGWFTQQDYGQPSSLPWAVVISPSHRPPGYENFPTFQPMFLYQTLWGVASGLAVAWAARRFGLPGDRVFAVAAAAYGAGGLGLFWLGIGHLPVVLGVRAGELGDAMVLTGAAVYLVRARRKRIKPPRAAQKPALERDSPVM
jgi:prolipoprotein diacylglyceryltransferase